MLLLRSRQRFLRKAKFFACERATFFLHAAIFERPPDIFQRLESPLEVTLETSEIIMGLHGMLSFIFHENYITARGRHPQSICKGKCAHYNEHMPVQLKRVYEEVEKSDDYRILIDRLWPRGLSKAKAHIDLWLRDIAPSQGLRKWFRHDPAKWNEFQKRYAKELKENREAVAKLRSAIKGKKTVTLLFSASDEKHNNAVALRKILRL